MQLFSVITSVYKNDNPEYIIIALNSIFLSQTIKPGEIIVVVDGPVSKEIENTLALFENKYGAVFKIVRLKNNMT